MSQSSSMSPSPLCVRTQSVQCVSLLSNRRKRYDYMGVLPRTTGHLDFIGPTSLDRTHVYDVYRHLQGRAFHIRLPAVHQTRFLCSKSSCPGGGQTGRSRHNKSWPETGFLWRCKQRVEEKGIISCRCDGELRPKTACRSNLHLKDELRRLWIPSK